MHRVWLSQLHGELTHSVSLSRWGKCTVSAQCSCRSRTGLYKIPSHSTGIVSCRPLRASKIKLFFTMEVIKILAKGCDKESMIAESKLGTNPPQKGGTHTLTPSLCVAQLKYGASPEKRRGLSYCTVKTRSETKVNTAHVWFVISLQLSNCLLYSKDLQGKSGSRMKENCLKDVKYTYYGGKKANFPIGHMYQLNLSMGTPPLCSQH